MHGGTARGGAASPAFKHGLYSRYLPEGLQENYERIREDSDLTRLDDELVLLTLRISDLLSRLQSNAPPWELVLCKWGEAAQKAGGTLGEEFDELRSVLCEGAAAAVAERQIWDELRELVQEKTKTASAEWGRLRDLQGLVKLDQVMTMWRGLLEALKRNIEDPVLLRTVTADVLKFMPAPSSIIIERSDGGSEA